MGSLLCVRGLQGGSCTSAPKMTSCANWNIGCMYYNCSFSVVPTFESPQSRWSYLSSIHFRVVSSLLAFALSVCKCLNVVFQCDSMLNQNGANWFSSRSLLWLMNLKHFLHRMIQLFQRIDVTCRKPLNIEKNTVLTICRPCRVVR